MFANAGNRFNVATVAAVLLSFVDGTPLQMWQSTNTTKDRLTKKAEVNFTQDFSFNGPTIRVTDQQGQTITGFGGAFTEASGKVYKRLNVTQQQQFLEDYFGPNGNGYTVGRTHINSCDFSVNSYSFDDIVGDIKLEYFDEFLTRDTEVLIPLIHAAQQTMATQGKELKLLASPWSPPAWMKTNNHMDNSDSPCLKDGMASVWAKYTSKWISAYKAHGIPIWAMTVQNEPENNASWEACLMNASEEADFVGKYLGPEMASSHPELDIFVFDHNKDHVYNYAKTILSHLEAKKYVSGVAYHWYAGDGFGALDHLQQEFPDVPLLASEATWEAYRWEKGTKLQDGDWAFGQGYAHDIIGDLNRGAIGWIDWNLILDEHGGPNHVNNVCDSAMQVNFSLNEVYKHPQYYYIGHFSRFIVPGSVRLVSTVENTPQYSGKVRPYGVCTGEDGIQATSFKRPDGKITVVVLNCGSEEIEYKLQAGASAAKLSMPAWGIQTFMFDMPASKPSNEIIV